MDLVVMGLSFEFRADCAWRYAHPGVFLGLISGLPGCCRPTLVCFGSRRQRLVGIWSAAVAPTIR